LARTTGDADMQRDGHRSPQGLTGAMRHTNQ
jgi:hypothetical protein